jgi:hypothetical protein
VGHQSQEVIIEMVAVRLRVHDLLEGGNKWQVAGPNSPLCLLEILL